MSPCCQSCERPLTPETPSTDDGMLCLDCAPEAHPHAEELLSGRRVVKSWQDAVLGLDAAFEALLDLRRAMDVAAVEAEFAPAPRRARRRGSRVRALLRALETGRMQVAL